MEGWAECSGAWEDEWASAPLSPRHRALSEGDAAEYKITLLPFPTRSVKLWVVCYLSKVTVGRKPLAACEAERRPQSLTVLCDCWLHEMLPDAGLVRFHLQGVVHPLGQTREEGVFSQLWWTIMFLSGPNAGRYQSEKQLLKATLKKKHRRKPGSFDRL